MIKNENELHEFTSNYKSKWLKTEIRLKILEKKKINSQLELLTIMKKNMLYHEKVIDNTLGKADFYSLIDSHFLGKTQGKLI